MTRIVSRTEEVAWGWVRAGSVSQRSSKAPAVTNGSEEQVVAFELPQLG